MEKLFQSWLLHHCSKGKTAAVVSRLGFDIKYYKSGEGLPKFDRFVEMVQLLDPCLAGTLEHFLEPECHPEDYPRLTPGRAMRLFRKWLKRKLAETYPTRRCPDGSAVALAADLGANPTAVYGLIKNGKPTLRRFMELVELLEPALFKQIEESLSLK